jgi:hypothetical protein
MSPGAVGRKTRRAHRAANRLNRLAPVLSRAVDGPPLSGANLSWRQQIACLFKNCRHRTRTERLKTGAERAERATESWSLRVFRPTAPGPQPYNFTLFSRNALATTDTELNDIAAPAMMGLRSSP